MDLQITKIQTSISKDIQGLNTSVDEITDDVGMMAGGIQQMSGNMNNIQFIMEWMSQDINYGTRTFTYPKRLFKNMTNLNRCCKFTLLFPDWIGTHHKCL